MERGEQEGEGDRNGERAGIGEADEILTGWEVRSIW